MTATYTDNLRLTKQGIGDNNTTWGSILNTVMDLVDDSITGRNSISVATGSNITLTTANGASDQARKLSLALTGATLADINIIVPTVPKLYSVEVGFTGSNTITIKTASGTGVALKYYGATSNHLLYCDGTNVSEISVPQGIISMWSGTVASIPAGYVFCNGTNNTPDLRDRFIAGAKQDDSGAAKTNLTGALTQSGGSYSATTGANGAHSHTGSTDGHTLTEAEIPSHNHTQTGYNINYNTWGDYGGGFNRANSNIRDLSQTTANTGGGGSHSHTITALTSVSSHTHTSPVLPYYALAYIMRA